MSYIKLNKTHVEKQKATPKFSFLAQKYACTLYRETHELSSFKFSIAIVFTMTSSLSTQN